MNIKKKEYSINDFQENITQLSKLLHKLVYCEDDAGDTIEEHPTLVYLFKQNDHKRLEINFSRTKKIFTFTIRYGNLHDLANSGDQELISFFKKLKHKNQIKILSFIEEYIIVNS